MTWFTESRAWASGPWSLALRDDELADISYDGRLVLRSIRAVVRDHDWNTAMLAVDRVRDGDGVLMLHVRSHGFGSDFRGVVRVEADRDRLRVITDLESGAEYRTNRTGLVVLHPPGVAGAELAVTHADGTRERTAFPREISPHQPVRDIAELAWRHAGLSVTASFAGDVFEMEDQRNWTDASFKTYSRPLALPFPYTVGTGERVRQSVTLRAVPDADPPVPAPTDVIALAPTGPVPDLVLGAATGPDPAPRPEPRGTAVLVELDLRTPTWRAALTRAGAAGLPLDVRFVVEPDGLDVLAGAADALRGIPLVRVGVFDASGAARHVSPSATVDALRAALGAAGVAAPVVGGSRSHFTELNRERHRLPVDLDGLAVTLTPLFHSLGTEQLVESVAMQRLVARQAVTFAAGMPVHVGPICLRPRFNDVATAPEPAPTRDDLAEGYGAAFTATDDERQTSPELAAWTISSAAALSIPGVASIAWFEQWGPRGVRSNTGEAYPVAGAIDALAELAGGTLLGGDSPDGLLWALGSTRADETVILTANLDRRERALTIRLPDGRDASVTLGPASFRRLTVPHPEEDRP